MRYLHYVPREEDLRLVTEAFALESTLAQAGAESAVVGRRRSQRARKCPPASQPTQQA